MVSPLSMRWMTAMSSVCSRLIDVADGRIGRHAALEAGVLRAVALDLAHEVDGGDQMAALVVAGIGHGYGHRHDDADDQRVVDPDADQPADGQAAFVGDDRRRSP